MTERASPSPESRHAAISCLFGRAMLSLRLLFSVSILALSVTFGDSSPKGRALGKEGRLCGMQKPLPLGEVASRSDDGEGKPVSREPLRSDKQALWQSQNLTGFLHSRRKEGDSAGFIDFFPADVVYSKQPDILRSHHFFSPFKGGFCMLSYRKLAMRVLGRPLHTGGGYRFAPSGLSAGSSVCPDCRNAHHPYRPGFCRDMVHREW